MTPQEIANTPGIGAGGIGISGGGNNLSAKEKAKGAIYEQIKGQSKNLGTSKSFETGLARSGEGGLGSVDAVMWDMAQRLADAGLTSIDQLSQGKIPEYQQVSAFPQMGYGRYLGSDENGESIYERIPTGGWYYEITSDNGDSVPFTSAVPIPESEVKRLGLSGTSRQNVNMIVGEKTGYINKATGQPIPELNNVRKANAADGDWGRNTAGDGQTLYKVTFDKATGLPIFYNSQTSGKQEYSNLLKIAAIGTAIFAPQIGAAIAPGAAAATQLAIGSAISGFVGSGGDIEAGIKSGLAGYLGGKAGSWASQAGNSAIVGNIASNMTRTAILGGDMDKALVTSLVQVAPQVMSQYVPEFANLPRAVQESALTAAVDLMATGGDNLGKIALMGASNAATDYAVNQIEGYKDLRPAQKEAIRSGVSNVLQGKDLSNQLLSSAISLGQETVQNEVNNESAKKEGWSDYATQQAAKSTYGSKVTPEQYADKQETTEAEAKDIARGILGREPSEFEYMQLIGLPEGEAAQNSDLKAIQYNESTFDSNELAEAYKAVYGKEPTAEWLASDEAMDMLGRSDAQGKNMLQTAYTNEQNEIIRDKNWVTEDEAKQFWKDMGNTGPVPQEFMDNMLMTTETGAKAMSESYRIVRDDINATTFDGSKFKDQASAQTAAIKDGYNAYNWGNKTYYLMSPDQATQLQKDIAEGKTGGARPDAFFTLGPGATLSEQLAAAGNPEEYAYKQGDVITVVGKRMEVPDYKDLEAWKEFKDEKQAAGGDNFQSFLTEQFSILQQALKGAPEDSIGKVMADAAMFGYGKMAQLVQAFSGAGEAAGIPQAERATNIAKQVQSWSNKLVDQGIQNAEAAVLANVAAVTKESIAAERGVKPADISTAELYAQKTAALFKQVPNNPLGVSLFLAGEGIQEIPMLALSAGVGNVLKSVATKGIQMAGATGTNVFLNGTESFGGNYNEVKEYLRKQGVPESQIEALAIKSGFEAAAAGMLTAYVGDRALIKSFMGDLAKDSFGKVIATNSTKEWFLGNFEGTLQNMSAQIGKYGSIKSEDEWLNAGIMEGFAQKGIAAGVLTAASLEQTVAKDYDGKPVTYKEIIEGTKTFDPKTLDKSFSFGDGVNLGDAIGYHSTFITNPDITPDEYFYTAKAFRDNGFDDVTPQDIASIVGSPGEMSIEQIQEMAVPYAESKLAAPPANAPADPAFVGPREPGESVGSEQVATDDPFGLLGTPTLEEIMSASPTLTDTIPPAVSPPMGGEVVSVDPDEGTALVVDGDGNANVVDNADGSLAPGDIVPPAADTATGTVTTPPTDAATDTATTPGTTPPATGGEVVSVDPDTETALVVDGSGNVNVVDNTGNTLAPGDTVPPVVTPEVVAPAPDVPPASDAVPPTEATPPVDTTPVATPPTGGEVVSVDPNDGTALVVDGNGNVNVVDNTDGTLVPGDTVPPTETTTTANVTPEQVTKIVNDALKANPGLTEEAVRTIVSDAVATIPNLTSDQVRTIVGDEVAKVPAGITSTDVSNAIDAYMTANPGLSKTDVAAAISEYMTANPGLTATDLDAAISTATKGLATTEQVGAVQTDVDALETLIGTPSGEDASATGIIGQLEAMGLTDAQILQVIGAPATETEPATGLYKAADDAAVRGENAAGAVQTELSKIIGAPSVKDDPNTPDVDEALAATGLYGQIEASQAETAGQIGALSADTQAKYDALTAEQKALANAMNQQGLDLAAAINLAAQQTQEQIAGLGEQVDLRINELMQQGQTYQQATQQAIGELSTQNQQLQGLVGTQGRSANQSDIDALTEMLGGQRATDLTYDVTGDKQITQADIDFLTGVVGGTNTDWKAPVGSAWGATGLYGQLAANEAQRQADLQAQLAREQQAAAAAAEAQRQNAIKATIGQSQRGLQSAADQLQALQKAGMAPQPVQVVEAGPGFDVSDALNTGFFSGFQAKKAQQNQPQTTKIAAGGYIDDLLAEDMSVDDLLNLLR